MILKYLRDDGIKAIQKPPDDLKKHFLHSKGFSFHRSRWKIHDTEEIELRSFQLNSIQNARSVRLGTLWERTKEKLKWFFNRSGEGFVLVKYQLIAGKLLIQKLLFRLFNFVRKLLKLVFNRIKGLQFQTKGCQSVVGSFMHQNAFVWISFFLFHFAISIFKSACFEANSAL